MRRILFFLFLSVLCSSVWSQEKPNIRFKQISIKEGLSQSTVDCILQDKIGFMWFGTVDGLNKYDGYSFTIYRKEANNPNSLSMNDVRDIYEDKEGNLWVGTNGGGLNLYNREKDNFIHFEHDPKNPKSISNNIVLKIYEDSWGNFWVGTNQGLNKFDRKNKTFESFTNQDNNPNSLSNSKVLTIYEDKQRNLWVGTLEGLNLYVKENNSFIRFLSSADGHSMKGIGVRCIYEDSKGRLWVGTFDGGLSLFDRETKHFKNFVYEPSNPNCLNNTTVVDLIEDDQGMLWIGTEMGGINVFDADKNKFYHYLSDPSNPNTINNNSIYSFYKDRQGIIWIGTFAGGINIFDKNNLRFADFQYNLSNSVSLSNNSVLDILEDSISDIWIATDGGGLNLYDKKTSNFKKFLHNPLDNNTISKNEVLAIKEEGRGLYWVGTWNGGLNLFDKAKNKFTHYLYNPNDSNSLSNNNVISLLKDHEGKLWIATFGGGVNIFNPEKKTFKRFKHNPKNPKSIQDNHTLVLFEDSDNNVWIGTFNSGLALYDREKEEFTHFKNDPKDPNSISSNIVHVIFEDSEKNLWIGTRGGGLNFFDRKKKTFKAYTKENGLPNDVVHGILDDNYGNLWLSTNYGICKFNPKTGNCKNYSHGDGLQSNEFNRRSFLKTKDGRFFFGGINGFNTFHPDSIKINTSKPPIVITDFQIFNKSIPIDKPGSPLTKAIGLTNELVMSYKESVFSISFAALNFTNSNKNQYAYLLEGFDKNWNFVGEGRRTTYTNIPPGTYTFKVKGSNHDGVWNEEGASLKIHIRPPFWETWWFRSIFFFFLIGAIVGFYKIRMNTINEQKAALEQQVQRRTLDLIEASVEIKTQRDSFKVLNEQVMSSINYANSIQKAILPTREKIHSTVSDYFIIYQPKDVVSGDFYWFSNICAEDLHVNKSGVNERKFDQNFIAAVDCTGHGVPGAFMSIIGNILFNEVVNQKQILDPALILDSLDVGLRNVVSPSDGVNIAGMDVCLCKLEKENDTHIKVSFSGAKRPLFFVRNGHSEPEKIAGNIISIGSDFKEDINFITNELTLEKGSVLYLTTDGFMDQNGNGKEKYGTANFMKLIKTLHQLPLQEQKKKFEKALKDHQKESEQRDDITIIGVRL